MKMNRLLLLLLICIAASAAGAQVKPSPDKERTAEADSPSPDRRRPNLMMELGLSPEQVQQIKAIHQERRPRLEAAQRVLREANRALDEAVYADVVSESDIALRLKEIQSAQAETARLRADVELSVRKVLTHEQLVKFRELRRRFAESRQDMNQRRRERRGERPLRKFMHDRQNARPD